MYANNGSPSFVRKYHHIQHYSVILDLSKKIRKPDDNTIDEDSNVGYVDVTHDELFEDPVMSSEECSTAV